MLDGNLLSLMQWALVLAPIIFAMGFVFLAGSLKPILVPKSDIEKIALDLIDHFEDPEGAARLEEYAAWYRSDNFQQGTWRRVRKRIGRMQKIGSKRTAICICLEHEDIPPRRETSSGSAARSSPLGRG